MTGAGGSGRHILPKESEEPEESAIVQAAAEAGVSYKVACWRMQHNGDLRLRHAPVVVSCRGMTLTLTGWARVQASVAKRSNKHTAGTLTGIIEKRDDIPNKSQLTRRTSDAKRDV